MKKFVSFTIALMMMLSMIMITPASASTLGLDDNKIYVKIEDKYYEVEKGDIVTYDMTLKYEDAKIGSIDVRIPYDSDGLKFVPDLDEYGDVDAAVIFPVTQYATVYNFNKTNEILFNYSSINGIRFNTDDSKVFSGKFEVITDTPGVYEINGYFQTLADNKMNKIVYEGDVIQEFESEASIPELEPIYPDETPTDEPSSDEPSSDEPSSDEPSSDEPSSDEPSSDEPSSDEPSSDEPSSDEPSSEEGTTEEPSSDDTTGEEQPEIPTDPVEPEKVYIKADGVYYEAKKGDVFTYKYGISKEGGLTISTIQTDLHYDSKGLEFVPQYDEYGDYDVEAMFPVIGKKVVYNFNMDSLIKYNYMDINGTKIEDGSLIFCGTFKVTADSGVYDIYSDLMYLQDETGCVIVAASVKFDECKENTDCPELVKADIEPEVEDDPTAGMKAIHIVNSAQWTTTSIRAIVSDGIISESIFMRKIPLKAPNGAEVYKAYVDRKYKTVYFSANSKDTTATVGILDGGFYDNKACKWYADINDIPQDAPITIKYKVNLINSANWPESGLKAYAVKKVDGVITEEVEVPVGYIAAQAPNGAQIFRVQIESDYEYVYFKAATGARTAVLEYKPDWFYDNFRNEWYENLEDRPAEDSTEEPSSEEPTTEEPSSDVVSSEEPTSSDEASSEESSSIDEPTYEDPSVDEPTSEEPTEDLSSEEEPSSGQEPPSGDDPTDEPSSEEPSSEEPSSEDSSSDGEPDTPIDPDIPSQPSGGQGLLGDVDGNGKVEVLDATLIQRREALFDKLTDEQLELADTNKDGVVNVLDATMIQRFAAKFITSFD